MQIIARKKYLATLSVLKDKNLINVATGVGNKHTTLLKT